MRTPAASVLLIVGLILTAPPLQGGGAQSSQPGTTEAKPAAKPRPASPRQSAGRSATFDSLVKEAEAARAASRLEEAIGLYKKAVAQRPDWVEGSWHLGTIYYELDRHAEARDAFRVVTRRQPTNGSAWAFKGLCEFRLTNYDAALGDLLRGRELGLTANRDLEAASRYHIVALLNRIEQHEEALRVLKEFVQEGNDSPQVIELLGIATLRLPMLPQEVPGSRREQIMMAGRAAYFGAARLPTAARAAFDELLRRYPDTSHIHYGYGIFLAPEHPDEAVEQFKQELKVTPRHPWAKLQLAFEYIKRAEWEEAKKWAAEAVAEAPNLFVARKALGQILLETGDVEGAIGELEAGVKLAPNSPTLRFTLARAYRRAGRTADAEREQAEFGRLSRNQRKDAGDPQAVGGLEHDDRVGPPIRQ